MLLNPECILTSMFSSLEKCKKYIHKWLTNQLSSQYAQKIHIFRQKANKQIIILT